MSDKKEVSVLSDEIEEDEQNKLIAIFLSKLAEAENAVKTDDDWLTEEEVKNQLDI